MAKAGGHTGDSPAGIEKRKFIRLDSVFPVEYQLQDAQAKAALGSWHQGFSANFSRGGLGLNDPGMDYQTLEFLRTKSSFRVNLKIHMPILLPPVSALASVAWVKQSDGFLGPYSIGLKYEKIEVKDLRRIMRLVFFKLIVPRISLAAIIILLLGSGASAYYNFRLFSSNHKLVESMVSAAKNYSQAQSRLQGLKKEKDSLAERLGQANEKIKSTVKVLDYKIKSLKRDINILQNKKETDLAFREAEIKELKLMLDKLNKDRESLSREIGEVKKKEDAAALKLEAIYDENIKLEQANFEKMYQWLKVHQNPRTGLLASFEGDGQLEDQAFTYDQALAAIAFSYFKDYELAKKIFNYYLAGAPPKNGYYNAYYTSSGEPAEYIIHSGPNLWLGISVLQYTKSSGDKKYLPIAVNIARWIMDLQSQDPEKGLRGGPQASWYSTEHNLDAFAFFNMLRQATGDPLYAKAADGSLSWLKKHVYDNPQVPVRRGRGDSTIATDTYAWSLAALGAERLIAMGMDPEAIIKFAEDNCRVDIEYERPAGERLKVRGFDFAKGRHLARGGVISSEWTAQMVLSYKILSKYYASKSDTIKAKIYQEKADEYLKELTKLVISSPSRTGQGQGCLPYASDDSVDTGHGWTTPKGKNTGSVSATAYTIFAYYGFNPLELNQL